MSKNYIFLSIFIGILIAGFSWANEPENGSNKSCKSDENDKKECKNEEKKPECDESIRRALPPPFESPPFPSAEYQGYPLVGVPPGDEVYPLNESYSTRPPVGMQSKKVESKPMAGSMDLAT